MADVPGKVITIDMLREMFERMERAQQWDFSKPMVWGYFFTHSEPSALQEAAKELQTHGYRVVDVYLSEKEEPTEPDLWWLHVERVEVHSPETLDTRNDHLYRFAFRRGLGTYDGMDVGPAKI